MARRRRMNRRRWRKRRGSSRKSGSRNKRKNVTVKAVFVDRHK